jgi:hypothetical protein
MWSKTGARKWMASEKREILTVSIPYWLETDSKSAEERIAILAALFSRLEDIQAVRTFFRSHPSEEIDEGLFDPAKLNGIELLEFLVLYREKYLERARLTLQKVDPNPPKNEGSPAISTFQPVTPEMA